MAFRTIFKQNWSENGENTEGVNQIRFQQKKKPNKTLIEKTKLDFDKKYTITC